MLNNSCKIKGCMVGQEGICYRGESSPINCPHFLEEKLTDTLLSNINVTENGISIQWSGDAFGLDDLTLLTMKRSSSLVAIIGAEDSGKTTTLSSLYMILRSGQLPEGYDFAGSYTLFGWERLSHFLTLKGDNEFEFPPHTSSNNDRVPGLLHLAFDNGKGVKKDFIFSDAPGEWFNEWAINEQSPKAIGARWINQNADFFLLLIDCQKFAGKEKGTARRELISLAQRLKSNISSRPIGIVWTKVDVPVNDELTSDIQLQLNNLFQNPILFNTSVYQPESRNSFSSILQWIIDIDSRFKTKVPYIKASDTQDFFFAIR